MPKTCSEAATRVSLNGVTMATRWSVTADVGPGLDLDALQAALQAAVDEVDAQMSPWKPDSDLVRLNRAPAGAWVGLPPAIMEVIARAVQVCRLSDGAFDPAVGDLVDAWGFGPAREEPDADAIRAARGQVRAPCHQWLELDEAAGRARKLGPLQLDLCGIAKGYAVDRMVEVLRRHGVAHALAALDGELRALGPRPTADPGPSPWRARRRDDARCTAWSGWRTWRWRPRATTAASCAWATSASRTPSTAAAARPCSTTSPPSPCSPPPAWTPTPGPPPCSWPGLNAACSSPGASAWTCSCSCAAGMESRKWAWAGSAPLPVNEGCWAVGGDAPCASVRHAASHAPMSAGVSVPHAGRAIAHAACC